MPKERKKVLCMDAQRHAEYYGMQQTFDELYIQQKEHRRVGLSPRCWQTWC